VKRRIARWLFRFAPPAQRRRYGDDFDVLIDDLAGADELHWRQLLNIALVGGSHRLRQLRGVRRAGLVATALLVAGTVSFFSLHSFGSSPPRPSADGRITTAPRQKSKNITHLTASGSPTPVPDPTVYTFAQAQVIYQNRLNLARCMQSGGFPSFPDPPKNSADGRIPFEAIGGPNIDPTSATFQSALQTCESTATPVPGS
jgi:hypothetical protein